MHVERRIIDVIDTRVVIDLPESFRNRRVELIALTVDETSLQPGPGTRRRPSPVIAGKGRTLGDIVGPIVDETDWAESP